jgi:hypothetical protein
VLRAQSTRTIPTTGRPKRSGPSIFSLRGHSRVSKDCSNRNLARSDSSTVIYGRDAEWFAEAERTYRQLIITCEKDKDVGPTHSVTATHSLTLARALHEQGRFEDAEREYQLALDCWRSVNDAPAGDREFVISSILNDLTKCKNRETRLLLSGPDVVP